MSFSSIIGSIIYQGVIYPVRVVHGKHGATHWEVESEDGKTPVPEGVKVHVYAIKCAGCRKRKPHGDLAIRIENKDYCACCAPGFKSGTMGLPDQRRAELQSQSCAG